VFKHTENVHDHVMHSPLDKGTFVFKTFWKMTC